jgi:dipeptidyl aminopeptidase/acylaminoacyl peptidase
MPLYGADKNYPPTMLIHGTEDTDVPYEQSVLMAERLKEVGIKYELITIPGAEHGLTGGDPAVIDSAYRSAIIFVNKYMKK